MQIEQFTEFNQNL